MYEIHDHYLHWNGRRVSYLPSPNTNGTISPSLIVVHYTAGPSLDGAVAWLRNPQSSASAHLVIGRDGQIVQLAGFNIRTWHAGQSEWRGVKHVNDFSIGIELVNHGFRESVDDPADYRFLRHRTQAIGLWWQIYPDVQIEALCGVVRALGLAYPAIREIVGHEDVAPYRKYDPGPAFPMERVRAALTNGE